MKKYTKTCRECGTTFVTSNPNVVYCSPTCKDEVHRRADREYRRKKKEEKATGQKVQKVKTCPVCGKEFHPRGYQIYCSVPCQREHNKPTKEQQRERFQRYLDQRKAERKPIMQTCKVCGEVFQPYGRQIYCSPDCKRRGDADRKRKRKGLPPRPSVTVYRPQSELHRLAAQALANGMSYGQYVAMIEKGARYE